MLAHQMLIETEEKESTLSHRIFNYLSSTTSTVYVLRINIYIESPGYFC